MKLESPRTITADLATAHKAAVDGDEPIFVPASIYTDDRGWSIMNQFQGVLTAEGQINYSVMYPGVIKAWHRHQLQTDFWMCVNGHIKVGVHREDGRTWSIVTGEKKPGILIIPPRLWHGTATVGHEPAGMFYYVTVGYNARQPDEERRGWDSVAGFPWSVQHR
jgi:dTDP-4-dehydrorhamnose 3,5-epimerase